MSQSASIFTEIPQVTLNGAPLPDGWRWMKLGEICTRISNGTSTTQNTEGKGLPVTRIETISSGKINIQRVGWIDSEVEDLERYILRSGDILFSHINSVERLGNCALYDGTPSILVHGMNLLRIEVNKELVEPFYLLSFFKSELARKFYDANARRAIGQASLNTKDLSKLEIPLPQLSEQQRIASILIEQMAAVEGARAAAEAQLKAAKDLPAAYLREAFNSKEAKEWTRKKVRTWVEDGYITDIQDGNHGESHPRASEYVLDGVPFVMANNIRNNTLDLTTCNYITPERAANLRIGFSTGGDVLLTHKGSLGLTAVVPETVKSIVLTPQVTYYRPNRNLLNAEFLSLIFQHEDFQKQLSSIAKQATRDYVGITAQKEFFLSIPPLDAQLRIAQHLHERFKAAERVKKGSQFQLETINKLPQSLLRQAFTGKL
ncbi:MAG TPA: restriction endonuclease subunit S [Pyrinomonadaceae bacterium]|jgi:type I restriction enzyme S subunit